MFLSRFRAKEAQIQAYIGLDHSAIATSQRADIQYTESPCY
jgi:hypothetical protein